MAEVERRFQALLEAAPDAMIGVDGDGTILWVNSQTITLFGFGRDELVGQPIELLVPETARAAHPRLRNGYAAHPEPRPMGAGKQLAGRRKDGTEFPAEISLSAIEWHDGTLVCAAVRDVSDRIEAQAIRARLEALAEREALEAQLHQLRRLESLGQLAGGVAHDFNNLLGAIVNYAAFVRAEIEHLELPEVQHARLLHDVAQIQRAVERGAALTRQLLAFGRREVIRPEVFDLDEVIRGVTDLLRRTIGEDVELDVALSGERTTILADRGQMEQVLVNLAVNARDAMVGGGTLIVDTAVVMVDPAYANVFANGFASRRGNGYTTGLAAIRPGTYVRLRVSDTGTGMGPDVLEHAFEPFYTTKAHGEGTGLGLATVYGIVTQSGGFAQIYSEVGHGTSFLALFPYCDLEVLAPIDEPPAAVLDGFETVLVVEDDPAMREVSIRILERNGYRVLVAENGAEAVDVARAHPGRIDLLLTDVVMPGMLGKEVASRITTMRPGVRVVYMSGYAEPVLSTRGTLDPGIQLVEKPFSEVTLLTRLRQVLDS